MTRSRKLDKEREWGEGEGEGGKRARRKIVLVSRLRAFRFPLL